MKALLAGLAPTHRVDKGHPSASEPANFKGPPSTFDGTSS